MRVHMMQAAVADKFRSDVPPHTAFDEAPLLDELAEWLKGHGTEDVDISRQVHTLQLSTAVGGSGAPLSPAPPPSAVVDDVPLVLDPASSDEEVTPPPLVAKGHFVIATCGKIRRLHVMGKCYRRPGIDYYKFDVIGPDEPPPELYTARCGHCWPRRREQAAASALPSSSSSTSPCSSSSEE